MSEQRSNYLQQLEAWTESTIINPLHKAIVEGNGDQCDAVCQNVKNAIREKVLESYKNGLKAKARPARKDQQYAQAQTR